MSRGESAQAGASRRVMRLREIKQQKTTFVMMTKKQERIL